jgi:hypothetical protein
MTTESKRDAQSATLKLQPGDLTASDFFPPGTGWNKSAKPDIVDYGRKPDAAEQLPRVQQH